MKISVIIPTFNRENFILKAINSVEEQSYSANEIIIIDDGSTDNTKALLKNKEILYTYQENKGVSRARNQGILQAKNDWIAFLDSDDLWLPQKLEKQIVFHQNNPNILISHTDEIWIRNGSMIKQKKHQQKPSGFCFLDNLNTCKIGPSTVMIHKSVFEKVGYFDEKLNVCEDYDLWLRLSKYYEIGYLDEKLIKKIAGHENQLSFTTFAIDRFRIQALEKHLTGNYKTEVLKELKKKITYILKGAKKHNNFELINTYEKKLLSLQDLL